MIITPVIRSKTLNHRYEILKQKDINGCLYFHSVKPCKKVYKYPAYCEYAAMNKAHKMAENGDIVREINILV